MMIGKPVYVFIFVLGILGGARNVTAQEISPNSLSLASGIGLNTGKYELGGGIIYLFIL